MSGCDDGKFAIFMCFLKAVSSFRFYGRILPSAAFKLAPVRPFIAFLPNAEHQETELLVTSKF